LTLSLPATGVQLASDKGFDCRPIERRVARGGLHVEKVAVLPRKMKKAAVPEVRTSCPDLGALWQFECLGFVPTGLRTISPLNRDIRPT